MPRPADPAERARVVSEVLAREGFDWRASDNPIARLSPSELRQRLGESPDDSSLLDELHALSDVEPPRSVSADHPPTLDYRNFDTAIRDQGSCGSCWAFAAIAAMEIETRRNDLTVGRGFDLSERRLVSCLESGCEGGSTSRALDFLVTDGTLTEGCLPYRPEADTSCGLGCGGPLVHLRDYGLAVEREFHCDVTDPEPDARDDGWNRQLARALFTHGPLVASMSVPYEFFSYGSGVYRTRDAFAEGIAGCHAVALVGYSEPERFWIIKNSWGKGWGEGGYGRISWDDAFTRFGHRTLWATVHPASVQPTATATLSTVPSPTATRMADPTVVPATPTNRATEVPYPPPSPRPRPSDTAVPPTPTSIPPYPRPADPEPSFEPLPPATVTSVP